MSTKKIEKLRARIDEQRAWIERCGGDLAGYVTHYGYANDERHYGDGGEFIYAADLAALKMLEYELDWRIARARS